MDDTPPDLRDLLPLAQEWGVWSPHQCDEILEKKTTAELRHFVQEVEQRRGAIDAWLDSLPENADKWPKAAELFLFLVRNWHEAACELDARETHG